MRTTRTGLRSQHTNSLMMKLLIDILRRVLVNTWNNAQFPGYKSKLWGNGPEVKPEPTRRSYVQANRTVFSPS